MHIPSSDIADNAEKKQIKELPANDKTITVNAIKNDNEHSLSPQRRIMPQNQVLSPNNSSLEFWDYPIIKSS